MEVLTKVDAQRIRALLDARTFFWLDVTRPGHDDVETLSNLLGLHPAAIEDTREWQQLPRLDDYGSHVLLIFFTARETAAGAEPVEIHIYISGDWIVTARLCETRLDDQRAWLAANDYSDEDEILYLILDALADGWDPVIDGVDRPVDAIEEQIVESPAQHQLRLIYSLKQEVGELLRRAHPMTANFDAAVDTIHKIEGLSHGSREWLRDVDAHLASIASDLRRINGDLNALTDTFFNANAYRLSRLATMLAVGGVFFAMWTLVTGFFGQNFGFLVRHIDSREAFLAYEIGALVIPTLALAGVFWWRRRDWWK